MANEIKKHLADRLTAIQQKRFVGREEEIILFQKALTAPESPFAVLHICGPGGIGKTSLVKHYKRLAQDAQMLTEYLDGRTIDPSPMGFTSALRANLDQQFPLEYLAQDARAVIFIDNYEQIKPLDFWIRDEFLPGLSSQILVVIAGRNQPEPAWRTGEWRDLTRIITLDNLSVEDSQKYLSLRHIPVEKGEALIDFSHGHPLALALLADVLDYGQSPDSPTGNPEIIALLLNHFLEHVPTPTHREALEVCAHVRVTTMATLKSHFGEQHGAELFEWLSGLSFIEYGAEGLLPHDLVRDLIDTTLLWRDDEQYRQLHQHVRDHILSRLASTNNTVQRTAFLDLLYLHRNNPTMRPYYEWSTVGSSFARSMRQDDLEEVLGLVENNLGRVSVKNALYWWQEYPESFTIFCDYSGKISGFCCILNMKQLNDAQVATDEALYKASEMLGTRRMDRHEVTYYQRFLCAYEPESPDITTLISTVSTQLWLGTAHLGWYFIAETRGQFRQEMFLYLNIHRLAELGFEMDGKYHAVFGHDWRAETAIEWLDAMMDKELSRQGIQEIHVAQQPIVHTMSQLDWEDAVRQALKDWFDEFALQKNPLLHKSQFVANSSDVDPTERLRGILLEGIETLNTPRKHKFYLALRETYLTPARTQEAAAEALDLPFNTYRYQLGKGIQWVAEYVKQLDEQ